MTLCCIARRTAPCMSELPAETTPARLRVEASPRPPGGSKSSETELGAVSTTAVPHPDSRSGPEPRICKVGLWTNNAPSSSASTYLKIASPTFISQTVQARHSVFPREGKGMDDLVIRLQGTVCRPCCTRGRLAASKPLLRRPWPALGYRSVSLTRARSETSPARWAAWPRPTRSTQR